MDKLPDFDRVHFIPGTPESLILDNDVVLFLGRVNCGRTRASEKPDVD